MIVKTCLLISDDPDDHIEFSEALYDISDEIVVMTVLDFRKAIDLLITKKCVPEFVVLNLAVSDFAADNFFAVLRNDPWLKNVKVIAYGDGVELKRDDSARINRFIDDDLPFSELKKELKAILAMH
jgi:hypothetical protein